MSYDTETHLLERGYPAYVLYYTHASRPVDQLERRLVSDDALGREVRRVLVRSVEDHGHETDALVHPAAATLRPGCGGG